MSTLWGTPALISCVAVAVLAYPWGLLALVPLAVSFGIDLYHRFKR